MSHESRRLQGPVAFASSLSGIRLDAVVTAILLWSVTGVVLDIRSHVEGVDFTREGFLTPEHTMFYTGFLALGALVAAVSWGRYRDGAGLREAVPEGYRLGAVGLVVFALGGPGDLLWHTAFGAEANVEALASPTHLALATGGFLFATSPLRATLARGGETGRRQLPALVGAFVGVTLVASFTLYAQPAFLLPATGSVGAGHGLAALLTQAALAAGVVTYLCTRFRPVPGAATLLLGGPILAAAFVGGGPWAGVPAVVVGLLVDAGVAVRLPRSRRGLLVLAAGTPALLTAGYLAAVHLTGGLAWTVHLWAGAVYLAGCVGALVGTLAWDDPPTDRSESI